MSKFSPIQLMDVFHAMDTIREIFKLSMNYELLLTDKNIVNLVLPIYFPYRFRFLSDCLRNFFINNIIICIIIIIIINNIVSIIIMININNSIIIIL